jgi:GT2 family glycosyltransferase
MRGTDIIIPLYKNSHLIPELVKSLLGATHDLRFLHARILFVNDSPDDEKQADALASHLPRLEGICEVRTLVNRQNLGFVRSCNRGLELARQDGRDAVLLNSDAFVTPGALVELAAVLELDPMIGFVSPRSNNATICNSPYPERYRPLGMQESAWAHQQIIGYLPRITYVPTGVGFCLYIRHLMLAEFGLLDEIYGRGYNEENDFVMRSNRRGYRAVLANHAFVYHVSQASFSQSEFATYEEANRKVLLRRYPEYSTAVDRFFNSIEFKAQSLVSGFIPDARGRYRILFECSHLGTHYNGTFELAARIIGRFIERHGDRYACAISCSFPAWKFHQFDQVPGLEYAGELQYAWAAAPYMAAIRLAQPFSSADLSNLASLAPLTGFLMLDTIALDCQNLDTIDLQSLWQHMLQTSSIVGYISQFSCQQFRNRFRVPAHVVEVVSLLSTNSAEYEPPVAKSTSIRPHASNDYLLLVGNHYEHKALRETLALLREHERAPPLVVFGWKVDNGKVLRSYQAGELPPGLVSDLYAGARAVLFPSHYEGFGLPIMHALAYRKPVIARNLPVAREMKERVRDGANIRLFDTTSEMIVHAMTDLTWVENSPPPPAPILSWSDAADAWEKAIDRAKQEFRFDALCERLRAANPLSLGQETVSLRQESLRLQLLLDAYRASSSWRVTAPARAMVTFTRRCWKAVTGRAAIRLNRRDRTIPLLEGATRAFEQTERTSLPSSAKNSGMNPLIWYCTHLTMPRDSKGALMPLYGVHSKSIIKRQINVTSDLAFCIEDAKAILKSKVTNEVAYKNLSVKSDDLVKAIHQLRLQAPGIA